MKIPKSVAENYQKHEELAKLIVKDIEPILKALCENNNWLFLSRIKSMDSYAQKLECPYTGKEINDFYACSVVVANKGMVAKAIDELKKTKVIKFKYQKPKDLKRTKSAPDMFRFDSVRMYFSTNPSVKGEKDIDKEIFEVQVKTFLEYVWGIVSHDLDYKSNEYSWAIGKVCSQIKALLDSAELALAEAKMLSQSEVVSIVNDEYAEKQKFIDTFNNWGAIDLPKDLKRMVDNVEPLAKIFNLNVDQLDAILKKQDVLSITNLSPYYIVVKGLLLEYGVDFFTKIKDFNDKGNKFRIKLVTELDIDDVIKNFDEKQYNFIEFVK